MRMTWAKTMPLELLFFEIDALFSLLVLKPEVVSVEQPRV
tara:strand:- start:766 stop:885 length:120 start_codon:yes stop_codon:yes gene_type:complete